MNRVGAMISRQIWPRVSASKLADRLPDYLRQVAAPKLGISGEKIELEKIETGSVATVRRWKTAELGALYVRIWPAEPQARPAREHETAAGLFAAAGLAVPKLHMTDDSFATLRRWRLEASIEAEAPGEPFDTKRAEHREHLPEIARQLAALHRSRDVRWGKPWRPENEMADPRRYWAGRLAKFRERITPRTSQLTAEELKRGFEQTKRRLGEIQVAWPALIHGDVTGSHLFVGAGGALTWIDFGTVAYWFPEEDLAHVRTRLLSGQDFAQFLGAYAKHARGDRAIEPETIKTLAIFQLWERLNSRIQRRLRREARAQEAGETKAGILHLAEEQKRIEHQLSQIIMGER